MRTTNRHIIERINFEATMPEANFSTQQALGSWLRDVACPAIATACDELLPDDEYLRLEELEIDLGVFPTLDVDIPRDRNLLTDRLIRQLRGVLADHFLKTRHEARLLKSTIDEIEAGVPTGKSIEEPQRDPLVERHKEEAADEEQRYIERRFEQWLYFLEHGCLPWWGGAFPSTEVWVDALAETLSAQSTARTRLLMLVLRSRTAARRLAADLRHEAAFEALLSAEPLLSQAWRNWIAVGEALAEEQERSTAKLPGQPTWLLVGKETWWRMLLRENTDAEVLLRSVGKAVSGLLPDVPERRLLAIAQRLVSDSLAGKENGGSKEGSTGGLKGDATTILNLFAFDKSEEINTPQHIAGGKEQSTKTDGDLPAHTEAEPLTPPGIKPVFEGAEMASPEERPDPTLPFSPDLEPAAAPRKNEQRTPKGDTPDSAPNHWYVRHAGLVLVHPFLEPLFAALGYWQEGSFADETAQQRAVYLTHYLATGDPAGQEEDLVLPKLLCGWPVSGEPAVLTEPLTTTDLHEADEVLRAIIEHWPAIGKTSPDGLREGFFVRKARLLRRENDWELTVERKGQDILLGRLAWGISMVRCAWHEVFIKVVW